MFRQYMHDLMNDKKCNPVSEVVKLFLSAASIFYGFALLCHNFFYKVNILKSHKAPMLVFSVGNITLGGTGKTPFTIMLAKRLAEKGAKKLPAVLIRGYGEDEWKLLNGKLAEYKVKVFVGRDRVKNVKHALEDGRGSVILDDGFQHRRLKRDLDIVLVDGTNPFGNGFLFPRGILREPVSSLKRADVIVLTKTDKDEGKIPFIEKRVKEIAGEKILLKSVHKPKMLRDILTDTSRDLASIKGKTVCLLSAICDPSYFRHTAERIAGARVGLEFIFPDHYPYKGRDLTRIFNHCQGKNIDTIITTEKDAVKLKNLSFPGFEPKIFTLEIELELIGGNEEFDDEIARLYKRRGGDNI